MVIAWTGEAVGAMSLGVAIVGEWVDGEGFGDREEFFSTHPRVYHNSRMRARHRAWKDV